MSLPKVESNDVPYKLKNDWVLSVDDVFSVSTVEAVDGKGWSNEMFNRLQKTERVAMEVHAAIAKDNVWSEVKSAPEAVNDLLQAFNASNEPLHKYAEKKPVIDVISRKGISLLKGSLPLSLPLVTSSSSSGGRSPPPPPPLPSPSTVSETWQIMLRHLQREQYTIQNRRREKEMKEVIGVAKGSPWWWLWWLLLGTVIVVAFVGGLYAQQRYGMITPSAPSPFAFDRDHLPHIRNCVAEIDRRRKLVTTAHPQPSHLS